MTNKCRLIALWYSNYRQVHGLSPAARLIFNNQWLAPNFSLTITSVLPKILLPKPIGNLRGIKKLFITACERAGITQGSSEPEGIIFHDIRRAVKTTMLNAGVDNTISQSIGGTGVSPVQAQAKACGYHKLLFDCNSV